MCPFAGRCRSDTCLPSFGITQRHWYYAVIRLPICHLASLLCIACSTILSSILKKKEQIGYPVLPCNHCIACLAHRPRGSSICFTKTAHRIWFSSFPTLSTSPISTHNVAQSLSGLLPTCLHLIQLIT
jgi:hypothetical protein